jgi:hypothetical protein
MAAWKPKVIFIYMTKPHGHPHKKNWVGKLCDSGKGMAARHGLTSIIAAIVSSVVPTVQHFYPSHPMFATQAMVQASEDRTDKQISDLRNEDDKKFQDVWQAIGKSQQSKK